MKGLLRKEFYTMQNQLRSWILVVGVMSLYSVFMKSNNFLYALIFMISWMSALSAFSNDQYNHWDGYALALPLNRRDMVKGRYLFTLSCMAFSSAACLLVSLLINLGIREMQLQEMLHGFFFVVIAGLLYLAIYLPILYKFGVEKGRYVIMATFIGIFLLLYLAVEFPQKGVGNAMQWAEGWIEGHVVLLEAAATVLTAGFLYLSYRLSVRIYEKREF